jgi:GMP synthase-like glutamine amidotransferase
MRIHCFQHVPFEGLGNMEDWIAERRHPLSVTHFYNNDALPQQSAVDWLIIMGGPMGAYEEEKYFWLAAEKKFISEAIDAGKKVLGICLGAQLIAAALGAKVYPNSYKEIGWYPVRLTKEGRVAALFQGFPVEFPVFHWHGDTFDLPDGATHLVESSACRNQAFVYRQKAIALQFHLDVRKENVEEWMQTGAAELISAPYIQTPAEMRIYENQFGVLSQYMYKILDHLEKLA